MRRLSVIIPSYNSERTIEATLAGIMSQSRKDIISEVIVVDSSDDLKTKNIINRYLSVRYRMVTPGIRVIPAIGRNIGADYAIGDILAFIDSDALPDVDWAEKIMETWEQGCKAGGGSIALTEDQKKKPIPLAQFYLQFNEYMSGGNPEVKAFLPSCNLFCSKRLFREAGGFPWLRTAEDVMFGLKVSRLTKMWFVPEVKVYHIFREDLKGFLKNQFILGRGNLHYRRLEYPHKFYYRGIWPVIFIPGFALIKLCRIIFRVLNNDPRSIRKFIRAFPFFILGLSAWAVGFVKGVRYYEKI